MEVTETKTQSIHDIVNVNLTVKELQIIWDFMLSNSHQLNEDLETWKPINRKISGTLTKCAKEIGYEKYRKLREEYNF